MLLLKTFESVEVSVKRHIDKHQIAEFNKNVGAILVQMRKAKALSRRSVVKALPELTAIQIRQFERGEASPPACLFFELTKIYEADPMQIESALLEAADCIRTNRQ